MQIEFVTFKNAYGALILYMCVRVCEKKGSSKYNLELPLSIEGERERERYARAFSKSDKNKTKRFNSVNSFRNSMYKNSGNF